MEIQMGLAKMSVIYNLEGVSCKAEEHKGMGLHYELEFRAIDFVLWLIYATMLVYLNP